MNQIIKTIETAIRYHKDLYYNGIPEIDDAEYDRLENELREIDPTNPVLSKVGADPINSTKHIFWMPSIQKFQKVEDLKKWLGDKYVTFSYKLDGSSMSLVYKNGEFTQAMTRGNGYEGEDRTENFDFITIPKSFSTKHISFTEKGDSVVWGEVLIRKENFDLVNEERVSLGLEPFTSIRNAVAGILNSKSNKHLSKYLSFVAHNYFGDDSREFHHNKLGFLCDCGFEVPTFYTSSYYGFDSFSKLYLENTSEGSYPYLTDGIVITENRDYYDMEDKTSHHFRWNAAFKFSAENAETKVTGVTYQIGRTGKLTPVLEVEPTELSGCTISRVTAHNAKFINDNRLGSGSVIKICRSNEVIPKVLEVKTAADDFHGIENCPFCDYQVVWSDTNTDAFCPNHNCLEKIIAQVTYFAQTMDMEGISSETVRSMIKHSVFGDGRPEGYFLRLYQLTALDLINIPRFGAKKAQNIIDSISKSIERFTDEKFITALGFSGIGKDISKKLVEVGLDKIVNDYSLIDSIPGVGEVLNKEIKFKFEHILILLKQVKDLIGDLIPKEAPKQAILGDKLAGMNFLLSGSFSVKKSIIEGRIREQGGNIVGSVTKDLTYLVSNESNTSKCLKAIKLGKQIITEEQLNQMLI